MKLTCRRICEEDAPFLVRLFSPKEYAPIFAEQHTTAEDWRERMSYFAEKTSEILLADGQPVGWVMYRLEGTVCQLDLLVLLPELRGRGLGTAVLAEILKRHPFLMAVELDVQQRNTAAVRFYRKQGFAITGEEMQPVGDGQEAYYNMRLTRA